MNNDSPTPLQTNAPRHIVAAAGYICDESGRVLLVRTNWRGWEFPGGQVEQGEDVITALHREILEESGVEVELENPIGIYCNVGVPYIVEFVFRCRYVSGTPTPSAETPEVAWFAREEALTLKVRQSFGGRLEDCLFPKSGIVYRIYRSRPKYELIAEQLLPYMPIS